MDNHSKTTWVNQAEASVVLSGELPIFPNGLWKSGDVLLGLQLSTRKDSKSYHLLHSVIHNGFIKSEAIALVDPLKIPIWCIQGGPIKTTIENEFTISFFENLLEFAKETETPGILETGILLQLDNPDRMLEFLLLYLEVCSDAVNVNIMALPLGFGVPQECFAVEGEEMGLERRERGKSLSRRGNRSVAQLGAHLGAQQGNSTTCINSINSPNSVAQPKPEEVNLSHINPKTKHSIQQLILGGLRIRGVTKEDPDYKGLYHNTYRSVCFALRKKLTKDVAIPVAELQELVEKFLGLFTDYGQENDVYGGSRSTFPGEQTGLPRLPRP